MSAVAILARLRLLEATQDALVSFLPEGRFDAIIEALESPELTDDDPDLAAEIDARRLERASRLRSRREAMRQALRAVGQEHLLD